MNGKQPSLRLLILSKGSHFIQNKKVISNYLRFTPVIESLSKLSSIYTLK